MSAAAVIVAGGSGQRFGSKTPKQFVNLGSKPVWRWSYDVFAAHPAISEIVIVVPEPFKAAFPDANTALGGKTRTESVLNGLKALSSSPDMTVLIHDAARPGVTAAIIDKLIEALDTAKGAAPALAVSDALKRKTSALQTVDREGLYRVQTPQAFKLGDLLLALESSAAPLVDDLAAIENSGGGITLIPGIEQLGKITQPEDFEWIERMLLTSETRTGSGFDVHAFEPGDHITLCGIKIPHTAKLKGHSDADAAWHALTDALLGALALGDIGDHFPPSEAEWKNAQSSIFLQHAGKLAHESGYRIVNADITIICESPKIKPHRETMRRSTAECLGIEIDRVSVKATTTEGLGFTGRGEGIAAQANISLARQIDRIN